MKAKCEFVIIAKRKKEDCKPTNWITLAKKYFKRKSILFGLLFGSGTDV